MWRIDMNPWKEDNVSQLNACRLVSSMCIHPFKGRTTVVARNTNNAKCAHGSDQSRLGNKTSAPFNSNLQLLLFTFLIETTPCTVRCQQTETSQ